MKTTEITEEHRCQNPKCRKSLAHRRSDTKFCGPKCRPQGQSASTDETGREDFISLACKFPKQPQAEIVRRDRRVRHPHAGPRPENSGYCVVADRCACKCHQEASV